MVSADPDALDNIFNFRDVHQLCPEVRPGCLFRSGHTMYASERDADRLLGQYRIRTVLDLRANGDDEVRTEETRAANRFVRRLEKVPLSKAITGERPQDGRDPILAQIKFGSMRMILAYIWAHSTVGDVALLLAYAMFCMWKRVSGVLVRIFARDGLCGVSRSMVENAGPQIAAALKAVAVNLEYGAVLVHCSLGKDRTGVIIALILMIVGVDLDHIVADYDETNRVFPFETRRALLPDGLFDKDVFARADGIVIRDLDAFIRDRYGTLDQYLDGIGFDAQHRDLLRARLRLNSNVNNVQ